MSKYLGIDYGTKKTGISLSDENAEFAFPHGIVKTEDLVESVRVLTEQELIVGIVIGKSVATNGEDNTLRSMVELFAKKIQQYAPVYFEQEMFSSVEAHRYQTQKGDRDDSAAAIILQRFLDKKKK